MLVTPKAEGQRLNLLIVMYLLSNPNQYVWDICAYFKEHGLDKVEDQKAEDPDYKTWSVSQNALCARIRRLHSTGKLREVSRNYYSVSLQGETWYAQICRSKQRKRLLRGSSLPVRPRGRPKTGAGILKEYKRWGYRQR